MNLNISMDSFVANLLLKQSLTDEVLDEKGHVIFTAMSVKRQHRVVVVDTNNVEAFYVSLEDIRSASPYFAHRLATNTESGSGPYNCGLLHKEIGVQEFAFLLSLLCPTHLGLYPEKVHAGSLARALTLGIKYQIPDIVMQCRQLLMETDFVSLSTRTATKWFEALERSGVDEVHTADGRIQRPGRAHVIASMMNGKRWHSFSAKINADYSEALSLRVFRHRCDFIMSGLTGTECNCKDVCNKEARAGLICQLCSRRVCISCSKRVACAYEIDVALGEFFERDKNRLVKVSRLPSVSDSGRGSPIEFLGSEQKRVIQEYRRPSSSGSDCAFTPEFKHTEYRRPSSSDSDCGSFYGW